MEAAFSEMVTVTGTPVVEFLIGAATREAGYTGGSGTDTLAFAYQVADTDEDTGGAGIAANGLKLAGGTIKNAAGTADANLAHTAVADDDTRKVDGVAPIVNTVEITSTPGTEGTYGDGDAIRVAVAFSEAVEVGGSPVIGLTVGKTEREAGFKEAATPATAAFEYAVGAVDFDPDGVGIPANGLSGGMIRDLVGNEAVLDHEAVAGSATQKVAGSVGTPKVSIEGVTGREDMSSASLTVSLAFPSDFDVAVDYATSDGTATAGSDYTATSGTLTIPAGEPRATIAVLILQDTDDESDETFSVTLTRPAGALLTITTAEVTATIKDDDGATEAYFGRTAYSVTEGESRPITVNLIPAATATTQVRVNATNQGTTSSADYSVTPSVVAFSTGESSKEVTFTAARDQAGDDGEHVLLQLSPISGGVTAGDDATVTIRDPTGPMVSIRALQERVDEGSDVVFELTRDGDSAAALGVGLELEFHDKMFAPGTGSSPVVSFAPGAPSARFSLASIDDETNEGNGRLAATVVARADADYRINATARSASTIIWDDDIPVLTISVDKSSVLEGESWTRTLRRSGFSDTPLRFNQIYRATFRFLPPHPDQVNEVRSPGGLPAGAAELTSSRSFHAGQVGPLGVTVERELLPFDENAIHFGSSATPFAPRYTLGEPHSYSNARSFVQIEAVSPSPLTEGAAAEFRITRTDGFGFSATLDLELVVDVEQTGDYLTGTTGRRTITVPATIEQVAVEIQINEFPLSFPTEDDDRHEAAGTLKVVIADPPPGASNDANTLRGYQFSSPSEREASLDLADNDDEPALELPGSLAASEEEATLEVPVNLSNTADRQIKMKWRTKPATGPGDPAATAGTDYTAGSGELVFAPGEKAKTVTIAILDDGLVEDDERFLVEVYEFSGPVRGTDPSQIEVTIPNRDTAPTITVADESADEASGPLVFTVRLSEAYAAEATASYRFVHGNTSDADFASAPAAGTARFAAGETAITISLPLVDDALDEFDETLTLVVDNPVNAILDADPTVESIEAVGTIRDDDPEPVISITSVVVEEDAGLLPFTVSLDAPSGKEVGFAWETLEAGEGSVVSTASRIDYIAASGNLVFSPGETKKTIEITLVSDEAEEEDYETVVVRLSGITHATYPATYPPGPPRAAGRITDDDLPLVTIEIVGAAVRTEGDRISFRARRTDSDLHDSLTVFAHTVPTGSFGVLGANRVCLITIPRAKTPGSGVTGAPPTTTGTSRTGRPPGRSGRTRGGTGSGRRRRRPSRSGTTTPPRC